jgi:hypothetical protein
MNAPVNVNENMNENAMLEATTTQNYSISRSKQNYIPWYQNQYQLITKDTTMIS